MTESNDVSQLYKQARKSLSSALTDLSEIKIDDEEGNRYLAEVRESLTALNDRFDDDMGHLDRHAEWEKFTIAFFGETNAGKSTIIETLRILFNEKGRRQSMDANVATSNELKAIFLKGREELTAELHNLGSTVADQILALSGRVSALATASQTANERAARVASSAVLAATRRFWMGGLAGLILGLSLGLGLGFRLF
ncbi:hypothetical protein [Dyella sp.]|uniref:hypothetical protein n=1 Tax=Dyella sp. TaxID=1869338 RepID=UPI002FDA9731